MHYRNYYFFIFFLVLFSSGGVFSQDQSYDVTTYITQAKLNVNNAQDFAYRIGTKDHGIRYDGFTKQWSKMKVSVHFYDIDGDGIVVRDCNHPDQRNKLSYVSSLILYSTEIYNITGDKFKHNSSRSGQYLAVPPGGFFRRHSTEYCISDDYVETDSRTYFANQAYAASKLAKDRKALSCNNPNDEFPYSNSLCENNDGIIDVIIEVSIYSNLGLDEDKLAVVPSNVAVSVPGVAPIEVSQMDKFKTDALTINTTLAAQIIEKPKYYDEFKKDKIVDYAALAVLGDVFIARKSPHFPSIDGDVMPYTEHFGLYLGGGNNDGFLSAYNGAMLTQDMALIPHDVWGNLIPDFVFKEDYDLPSLTELDHFVTTNKHLPHVPNQADLDSKGFYNVNEMLMGTLRNLEELYLHTIRQHHTLEKFQADTYSSSEEIHQLENRINNLKEKIK